jgi:Ca2+/Na+ antiporter
MSNETKKTPNQSESKSAGFLLVSLIAICALPAAVMFFLALYQSTRAFYCSYFNDTENSITLLLCRYFSYDFRPDVMLIVFFVFLFYPVLFVLRNRRKSVKDVSKRLVLWLFLGGLGFIANWRLTALFNNESWW